MNIDRSAFDLRRELGTMSNDPATVGRLKVVFDSNWDLMSWAADHDWRAYTLTAICPAIFLFSKTNPLIVVFAVGVLGYFGIV